MAVKRVVNAPVLAILMGVVSALEDLQEMKAEDKVFCGRVGTAKDILVELAQAVE